MSSTLPDRAQVVIVGGGIVGCSIAYHLTRRGVTDVLVLEQGQLTGGTTWHAAGLVSQLKSSHSLTRLATYSARLFEDLEAETGQATGYRTPGSISVAADDERWEELLRGVSMASTVGVEIREIELDEAVEHCPLLNVDDLVGALYIPHDGVTSPVDTTMALAKGAKQRGTTIVEGVAVQRLEIVDERIAGVHTESGFVEAETVVLAGGMWTRQLADTAGIKVPLQACEHFYIVTEPIEGVERGMPTVRDPGNYTYFKEETGKIMAGFFEPRGKIWNLDHIPRDFYVPPHSGGTLVVRGSHRLLRRFLAGQEARVLEKMKRVRRAFLASEPYLVELASREESAGRTERFMETEQVVAGIPLRVVELTGEAGDVVLCDPWLLHTSAANCGDAPRIMCVQRIRTADLEVRDSVASPRGHQEPVPSGRRRP